MAVLQKILLVEDDEFTRFMMKEIINTLEVPVDVAVNGEDGCSRIANNPEDYALVLKDIHMPKLSGVGATKMIRSSPNDPPRNVPIIAVTADARYHDQSVVTGYGMDGFISKPVTTGQLQGVIEKYCLPAA